MIGLAIAVIVIVLGIAGASLGISIYALTSRQD